MATVKRRADRGGKWEVRYRDPEGRQRTKSFDRKVDADRYAATTEAKKLQGDWIDPAAGKVTFAEYARAWQSVQVHRPSTAQQVDGFLRIHLLPTLGDAPMASIRPTMVQAWVRDRSEVIGANTLQTVYRYFVAIMRAAVADRVVARTPFDGVKLPKKVLLEVIPPTVDAVRAIEANIEGRYRALVTLTAGTGLRQGEAFGLTVDRVDFLRRTIRVDRQVVLLKRTPPYLGPPKTDASYRTIPLPDVVGTALAAHLKEFPVTHPEGLIFTNRNGEMLRRTAFNPQAWQPALKASGLHGVGFHGLRHFYASLLIRHGESVKVVQKRLGHATAAQTLDTYGHLWSDSDDMTRAAVDSVLGSCAPNVRQESASDA